MQVDNFQKNSATISNFRVSSEHINVTFDAMSHILILFIPFLTL
jgi:hypothetical protein